MSKKYRLLTLALVFFVAIAGATRTASAEFIFTISQAGDDVLVVGTGTINPTGLTAIGSTGVQAEMDPSVALLVSGTSLNSTVFSGLSGPATFGLGGVISATSTSGDAVGVQGEGGLLALSNFGVPLSTTSTYLNKTIAGLGLTPGIYTYTLPADSISIVIVPEPSTWLLVGIGAVALLGLRVRAHRRG